MRRVFGGAALVIAGIAALVEGARPTGGWMKRHRTAIGVLAVILVMTILPAGAGSAVVGPRGHASIIGGKPAVQGMFPWLAFIADKRGRTIGQCTGTVVAPNLVLTAGHCAEDVQTEVERDPTGYIVVTGNVDWTSPEAQVSLVSEVIVYPGFHSQTSDVGDAALLVLSTPTTAPAISLGSASAGTRARIAGWGLTSAGAQETPDTLQWAEVTVQSPEWCEQHENPFDAEAEICAIDENGAAGACKGDSGGSLIVESPSAPPVEIGVDDEAVRGCSPSYAGTYASAALIEAWVQGAIRDLAPLTEPPASPLGPTANPGRYVTVGSHAHRVAVRVSGNGQHVVNVEVKATVNCQHGYTYEADVAWPSYNYAAIHNHTARMTLGTPANRYDRAGRFGVYLRFNVVGYVEGDLSIDIRSKTRRAGLCSARAIHFIAHPASG